MLKLDWLNIELISQTIQRCRKKELMESDLEFLNFCKYQLPIFLKLIEIYKEKGVDILKNQRNIIAMELSLFDIEAKVISIINVAIYERFNDEEDLLYYLKKNDPFKYNDYLNMVSYYAKDFEKFSFLASFYMKKIEQEGIVND